MTKTLYVKDKTGRFAGSIGSGKTNVPTEPPARTAHDGGTATLTPAEPAANLIEPVYQRFRATSQPRTARGNPWGMNTDTLTAKTESRDERVKAILGELETGVENLATSDGYRAFLDTCAKFHSYSTNNQMLIATQNPDATKVAGFTSWKKLGRSVKKGEKGIVILRPVTVNKKLEDDAGRPVLGEDGKPRKVGKFVGTAPAYVFDVSQTDGEPLPENPTRHLTGGVPDGLQERLVGAVLAQGFTVSFEKLPPGLNGYTSHDTKRVVLAEGLSPAQAAKTTAHELGHVIAHADSDPDDYHTGAGGCRGRMEVEAESIAYVVCKSWGMDTKDYTFGYVTTWGNRQDGDAGKTVRETAEKVRISAHTILDVMSKETDSDA